MKYNTEEKTIVIDKELNLLDKFVITFVDILEKYTDYVIVSGYVSILLGRTRATEDIDLLIPALNIEKVKELKGLRVQELHRLLKNPTWSF